MCEHEYVYENWVINCYKCGSTWDIADMVELASRVPVLEREREEWKIRASDLSHTISEMKIGIEGLFGIIRECLPKGSVYQFAKERRYKMKSSETPNDTTLGTLRKLSISELENI